MELVIMKVNGRKKVILLDNEMRIVKPVHDFLRFQRQKECADNTVVANGSDLKLFWEFLNSYGYSYEEIIPRGILDFIDYLRQGDSGNQMSSLYVESSRTSKTINRILSTVHSFYKFCATFQAINNPIVLEDTVRPYDMFKSLLHHARTDNRTKKSVFKVKESRHSIKLITEDEAETILDALPTWRDKLLFKVLYLTGARIQEALDLQIEEIPYPDSSSRLGILKNIKSKGKCRDLYVPMELIDELDEFILVERSRVITEHGYLFITQQKQNKGHPLTYRGIYEVFRRVMKKSGISFTFHDARHSFITKLVESGMDIRVSRPRESHPQSLSEPDLNLSAHPAPIIQPLAKFPSASGKTVSVLFLQFYPASSLPLCDVLLISYISFSPSVLRHYSYVA